MTEFVIFCDSVTDCDAVWSSYSGYSVVEFVWQLEIISTSSSYSLIYIVHTNRWSGHRQQEINNPEIFSARLLGLALLQSTRDTLQWVTITAHQLGVHSNKFIIFNFYNSRWPNLQTFALKMSCNCFFFTLERQFKEDEILLTKRLSYRTVVMPALLYIYSFCVYI